MTDIRNTQSLFSTNLNGITTVTNNATNNNATTNNATTGNTDIGTSEKRQSTGNISILEKHTEDLDKTEAHKDDDIHGIIVFEHEPASISIAKWIGWIIVMILIVLVFIYFGMYFGNYECDINTDDLRNHSDSQRHSNWNVVYDTGLNR